MRRILALSGWQVALGRPGPGDHIGVWGQSPRARRGEAVAARHGAPLVRIEDAFLRSLHPGREGEPPLGLLIDRSGMHFDARQPSDLETLLATHPLDDSALLARARAAMARMQAAHLSKYSATRTDLPPPEPGYVLVVDQTDGDASTLACGADRARFLEMLYYARAEHPGKRILLKTHPETTAGHRPGHYRDSDAQGPVTIHDGPQSPWTLLEGAVAVYTVSSQMGFEAILAGHRPRVFGTPFYAGWGLTEDQDPVQRRQRSLTRAQIFAAAMILYPVWYDPFRDRLCQLEDVLAALEAGARAWREDRAGWVASGMRLWKRPHLQGFFGHVRRLRFEDDVDRSRAIAARDGRRRMAWASKAQDDKAARVEDGFLRSRGLGAALVPPMSLVLDDLGIYYDPSRPSRLEQMIAQGGSLGRDQIERSEALISRIIRLELSKYNITGDLPDLPKGHRILVPGQVEDDASILRGSPELRRNADLLARARAENPKAVILYKPHPDVEAGLREGHVDRTELWADLVLNHAPIAPLLSQVSEIWTITSLTGFEGLLRGLRVTTLGVPFYAGWGLTRDLGVVPARRLSGPRPSLAALVHATLIAYPRYRDPVTGQPCPVEVILDRLESGAVPRSGPAIRALAKMQGLLSSHTHLWR
ncbi:capsular polysaccharide biosynthesis protein [Aestuariicoccus sp. KMU-90]|uniref:Capsular polysaccharide biosynthesis protein n=1 Tax=Thetidibacter halocola TaxID=2827239 RepID=A0A8J8BAL3_9RHOB|nr:capsular polysaccharide biosynthesis protein [Thetidibacter halocola]